MKGFSQEPDQEAPFESSAPRKLSSPGLYGKVVDSRNNRGIDAASIQIFIQRPGSATADSLLTGMLTQPNGEFSFPYLAMPDTFNVLISALGYTETMEEVTIAPGTKGSPKDLGNIKLANSSDMLGEVTIVAQKPTLQMGIDRRTFNVDKNLTSAGGTAIDVMRNIPSLSVDAEGNVQLRNASPQIFVDGRPTILTLDQIPADDIERVEMITNPSAKFDAASSGGILNVVLKKNKRLGFNGLASAGVGTPGILNGNLSMNLRQNKFNFFLSTNYNQSGGLARSESIRQNKRDGVITDYFNQQSANERSRKFTSLRFGVDYFLDNRNTITVSQNFVRGRFGNYETQDQQFLDVNQTLTQTGERISDNLRGFNRSETQLNYTHSFPKAGRDLTADITYSNGRGDNRSLITNYFYAPDGSMIGEPNLVRNSGSGSNQNITVQVDFVNPITENSKLEMGLRYFRLDNSNIFDAFSVNNNAEVKLPLSTNVRYDESVSAAYMTYSNKINTFSYQLGLRGEYSVFNGQMVDSAQNFGYKLPLDIGSLFDGLFPSVYLSKQVGEGKEMQLNFSRRIRRPSFWQLNPFIDIDDPLNISQGNPRLRPEYTNSFEFNFNNQYSKGNFLASLYFRNNVADITRYSDTISAQQFEQLNNAAISPNAILNTFINAQYTNRMGAEFTLNHRVGGLEVIPNLNLQYRKVKATVGDLNLGNEGFNWQGKLIFNYRQKAKSKVFNNLNYQLTGEYESPRVIPQGRNREQYQVNFALRKEFMKNNAASVTLVVNDVFNSNRFGEIYDTENFYQDSYRRWNVRNFRITFSYRFGKRDFNMFNRERRSGGERGDD